MSESQIKTLCNSVAGIAEVTNTPFIIVLDSLEHEGIITETDVDAAWKFMESL